MAVQPLAKARSSSQMPSSRGGGAQVGRCDHGNGMPAGRQRFDDAQRNHPQQAEDEQIGRRKEDAAGGADAAQIHQRYHNQNRQA
jgi:hypothetical protein